ncbi:hypothetical protein BABINDRAFT_5906 [Babjeviella inositovora NRRL Y-12698]|uniref:cystathionine gamma-synthase n=1 Tax=Babjeviella inositovora NRRL Y-12698 TaxID=984486 RepID=A0A1E3QZR1_9ASCO|nr:uncharacterized protein BABINDRAFT_5906 [Babjeviella inositovora NRRL Y-12698]ODQ83034.1 hypothetical protein BABINDRAFT_5906 [Babjeviella inositovora NRRL Y-12698]
MSVSQEIGASIPNNTEHAVSVTLPTWKATVGYEEGEDWVVSKMNSGYPRFFIHLKIKELARYIETQYGRDGEQCMIFPTPNVAKECRDFIKAKSSCTSVRVLRLSTPAPKSEDEAMTRIETSIGVVFFPESEFPVAKQYWQHAGQGISSRMGEYCLSEFQYADKLKNGPSPSGSTISALRPQTQHAQPEKLGVVNSEKESSMFIEEKFGRNLNFKDAQNAKDIIRKRISGKIDASSESAAGELHVSGRDVFLYPSGMAAIYNSHKALLSTATNPGKSVCYGFPYVDTLNILRKWGPGCIFLGFGDDAAFQELETLLETGGDESKILAVFCECPSNPLLKTPNLPEIRRLADKYGFAVVVDETVGNIVNIHVLPYVDMVASSLTKVFSGDSNVMGGSLVLNPNGPKYATLTKYFSETYDENLFFAEDALYLERNSRDFAARSDKINVTSELVVDLLVNSPLIKDIFYPSLLPTKKYYDLVKTPQGGYGGLISFVFHNPEHAIVFFDSLKLSKGPSLGTNFTLACPYAILAHYGELDEVEKWGVDRNIVRISIGLEDRDELLKVIKQALDAAQDKV